MTAVAGLGGLFHGRVGILLAGVRGDGEQVGSLAARAGRGEQAGGLAGEPAEPHDAAACRAVDPEPAGPAGVPVGHAEHNPVDGAVPLIQGQDQPG